VILTARIEFRSEFPTPCVRDSTSGPCINRRRFSSTIGLDDINAGMDRLAARTQLRQLIAFDDTGPGV
jgi:hypothetical protein